MRPKTLIRQFLLALLCCSMTLAQEKRTTSTVADTYREAYARGYQDGVSAGYGNRDIKKPAEPSNLEKYQEAESGYDRTRHDRTVYQVAYRRGFKDGYEVGLHQEGPPLLRHVGTSQEMVYESSARPDRARPKAVVESLPAGTEIRIELLETISTKYNERGDLFNAQVFEPVELEGQRVIPVGTRIEGAISYLKRAGRIRGRAQIALRFDRMILPDQRIFPIQASVIALEPRSPEQANAEGTIVSSSGRQEDAKRLGQSSAIGAVVGVLGGGQKGAAVGAAAGAVAGLATVLVTRGRDAQLEIGTQLTIRLLEEVQILPKP